MTNKNQVDKAYFPFLLCFVAMTTEGIWYLCVYLDKRQLIRFVFDFFD